MTSERVRAMLDHMSQRVDAACRIAIGVGDGPINGDAARRVIEERKLSIVRVGGVHETYELRDGSRALWRGGWRFPLGCQAEWHEEWFL